MKAREIFGRLILLFGTTLVSALALLLQLPGLKEGVSLGELPFLLVGLAGLAFLAWVWWVANRRTLGWAVAAWVILALPALAGVMTSVSLIFAYFEGARLAREAAIESYSETPIQWPGFDGPIGLTVEFDLVHPEGISALISPPEIRMGPEIDIPLGDLSWAQTGGSGYFKDRAVETEVGNLTLLKTVLFQRHYKNRQAEQPYQNWDSTYHFEDGRTALTYHLHPGLLEYLAGPERLCLSTKAAGIPRCAEGEEPAEAGCASRNQRQFEPLYHTDTSLTALWMAAGPADMRADLGALLTRTLREKSSLQGDPEAWTAMQKRLEPEALRKAGYRLCPPGEDSHTRYRTCFCRDIEE